MTAGIRSATIKRMPLYKTNLWGNYSLCCSMNVPQAQTEGSPSRAGWVPAITKDGSRHLYCALFLGVVNQGRERCVGIRIGVSYVLFIASC